MATLYCVRLVDENATYFKLESLQAFEDERYAAAYAGALDVAEIPCERFELPINDRDETAERIRETIAHLADKGR